jgi:glycosyltransferase involved in cell wall biosynthesis
MPPVTVIPTCADLDLFRPMDVEKPQAFVLGYVGSAGTWQLFDEVAACFAVLHAMRNDARLLIVNRGEHDFIRERLAAAGIPPARYELLAAEHGDVPAQMARMSAGVFFNKPCLSRQGSAPTKLGEFLGCGVPCLSNAGYGDVADILESERVGVAIADFEQATLRVGLQSLIALSARADIASACVAVARKRFSLEQGVAAYDAIYAAMEAG